MTSLSGSIKIYFLYLECFCLLHAGKNHCIRTLLAAASVYIAVVSSKLVPGHLIFDIVELLRCAVYFSFILVSRERDVALALDVREQRRMI